MNKETFGVAGKRGYNSGYRGHNRGYNNRGYYNNIFRIFAQSNFIQEDSDLTVDIVSEFQTVR